MTALPFALVAAVAALAAWGGGLIFAADRVLARRAGGRPGPAVSAAAFGVVWAVCGPTFALAAAVAAAFAGHAAGLPGDALGRWTVAAVAASVTHAIVAAAAYQRLRTRPPADAAPPRGGKSSPPRRPSGGSGWPGCSRARRRCGRSCECGGGSP